MDPIPVDAAAKPPATKPAPPKPPVPSLLAALPLNKRQLVGAGVAALSLCAGVGVVKFWSPAPEAPPEKHDAPVLARGATPKSEPQQPQTPPKLAPIIPPQPAPPPDIEPRPIPWFVIAARSVAEPLGHPGRGYTLDPRMFPEPKPWQVTYIPTAPAVAFAPASSWPNTPSSPAPLPVAYTPQLPVQPSGGFPQVPLAPPTVTPIQAIEPKLPAVTPPALPMLPDVAPPVVVPDARRADPMLPLLPAAPAKVELPAVGPVGPGAPPAVTPFPPPTVAPLPTPAASLPIPGAPVGPSVLPDTQPLAPPALTPPTLTPPTVTPTPPFVTPTPPAITPTPPGPAALPPVTPVGGARPPEPSRTPQTSFDVDLHDPKAGETYEVISKSFYNDARYARALAAFNNNRPLQGGAMIEVPPVHVLRNRFGQLVGIATTPVPTPAEPAFRTAGRRFVVPAGGMSLPAVARQTLGSEARWRDIYDLNPQVAPGLVAAGTELRLPPDATAP